MSQRRSRSNDDLEAEGAARDFLHDIGRAAESLLASLEERRSCLIVTHYDADGVCAAAALARTLCQLDTPFHIRVVDQLDETVIGWVKRNPHYKCVVMTDLGSGLLSRLEAELSDREVFVVDHHIPEPEAEGGAVREVNPHRFGIDGSTQASSSTLAYLLVRSALPEEAPTLSPLAVVGALGDRQDVGRHFSLTGLNEIAVRDGVEHGYIKRELGLRLFGLRSRPLLKCLEYTFDPYLPGLSGDEAACYNFLKSIGVKPSEGGKLRYFKSLSREEVRRLATELIKYSMSVGLSVRESERIFGTTYLLPREGEDSPLYDAREFAAILNACGRVERHDLALLLAMGVRGRVLSDAMREVEGYRRALSSAINEVRNSRERYVSELDHLVVVDLSGRVSSRMLAAVASILASSKVWGITKPLMAITKVGEDALKVSLRKPISIDAKYRAVNLGQVMRSVADELGGVGGGHENAAGGTFSADLKSELVRAVEAEISRAISA